MSDNYLLYDPAAFGALEIKEDTRDAEILRLRAENEELRAALKPITDIKAFTCIFEWTPVEALRDDEKVHVKLTGAQIKAMRAAAAALKETE